METESAITNAVKSTVRKPTQAGYPVLTTPLLSKTLSGEYTLHQYPKSSSTNATLLSVVEDSLTAEQNSHAMAEAAPWTRYVRRRFSQLQQRGDEPTMPRNEIINCAWRSIEQILPPRVSTPAVFPSFDGGIEFVWHEGGWNVEIEVDAAGETYVWARQKATGEDVYGSLDEHRDYLLDVLHMLSDD